MATQQSPKLWRLSVDAVADLSTLFDTRMSDGDDCWVVAAGVTHGKWVLDKSSTSVVDNLIVVATLSAVGRWIFFGGGGGSSLANISVPNQAALTAFGVSALNDGALAFVGAPAGGVGQAQESTWQLITQQAGIPALLNQEVIASSVAGRVWTRLLISHARSMQQATWNVDPTNGNDENDGTTNPIQTYAEYIRRNKFIYIPQTVNILASLPDSDNLSHSPEVRWHQSLSATYPSLTIVGTRTAGGNLVVATSSDETGNQAPRVDAGAALTIGSIIIATSGAQINATAVVTALIAGTNFETSPWRSAAGARVAPPAAADTIAALTLPTVNIVAIGSTETTNGASIKNLNIKGSGSALQMRTFYTTCTFPIGSSAVPATASGSYVWFGCGFLTANVGPGNTGTRCGFLQCGFTRASAGIMGCSNGAILSLADCTLRNWTLDVSPSGQQVSIGGFAVLVSVGFAGYGNAGSAIVARGGGAVKMSGTVYGPDPGGASIGTDAREGGNIYVSANITPTLTGATELIFEGAGTANAAPPLATGIIPAAVALTTWAQWVAAPFGRNVMSYKARGGITNFS